MTHGGRRDGAGRPKGAKDKRPRLTVVALAQSTRLSDKVVKAIGGELPLAYMLAVMNDESQPQERRDEMAIAAANFCHPRLSVFSEVKRPSQMSDRELEQAIAVAEEDALKVGVRRGMWPRLVH